MRRLPRITRRSVFAIALGITLVLAVPAVSIAQSPDSAAATTDSINPRAVLPERPTVATHAYTVAPGYVEIEAGGQDARPRDVSQFAAPVVVKLGITQRVQLEIQGGYSHTRVPGMTVSGSMDVAFALKHRVLDAAPVLHDFSIQAALKLPTGADNVTTKTTDASILLISSRAVGAGELDLNAGYTRRSGNGATAPVNATLLTASFGAPIDGAIGGVAEVFSMPATSGPAGTGT